MGGAPMPPMVHMLNRPRGGDEIAVAVSRSCTTPCCRLHRGESVRSKAFGRPSHPCPHQLDGRVSNEIGSERDRI